MMDGVILGIAAGLVLWAVSEEVARYFLARSKYRVWLPSFRIQNELLAEVFPNLSSKAEFAINSDGERGGEPPLSDEHLYRVLVAGGSAAECYFLDQAECWPMRLQRSMETPEALSKLGATRVHVGSIARSGFDSAKLHLALRRVIPQYSKVDAVVIMVGASNIYSWLADGAQENPRFSAPQAKDVFECHPETRYAWYPLKRNALAQCWRILRPRLSCFDTRRMNVGASVTRLREMRRQAKTIKTEVPVPKVMLDNFAKSLEGCINTCRDAGARVLVIIQPWLDARALTDDEKLRMWNGAEGNAYSRTVSTYYSLEVLAQLCAELSEVAARVAEKTGAGIVRVQSLLRPPADCFYDDNHFTPFGAEIVARAVNTELLERSSAR